VNKFNFIILAVLVFTITVMSGCSLITTNEKKYMAQTVAVAESKDGKYEVKVSMEEFSMYYANYASNYIQNGMSDKQVVEQIVDMIINRKLFVDYLKDYELDNEKIYTLTNKDINDCWTEVYKYVYEQLDSYEVEIYNDWGLELNEEEKTEEETSKFVGREDYEHTYVLNNGVLTKVENENSEDEDVALNPNPFKQYFWQDSESEVKGYTTTGAVKTKLTEYSDGIREEEMKRFVKALTKSESYKKEKDTSPWAVFERELNRVYKIQEDNKYIQKYEEFFNESYQMNSNDILSLYESTILGQMEKYATASAYNDAMKADNSTVYYHPTQGWFYVSHLLIGFDDEQKALIEEWEAQVKKGIITEEEKEANIATLRLQLKATARDSEGKNTSVVKSASQILTEVNNAVSIYGNDVDGRVNAFTDLIFKYTSESSFLTRDFDYAIPVDKAYDSMVEEFATASRELYENGLGSVSGLVYTEYGAHIIMFTGLPANANLSGQNVTLEQLWGTKLKTSSDKNMLDLFAEKVTKNDYATQQNKIIDQLRADMHISYSKTKLKKFL